MGLSTSAFMFYGERKHETMECRLYQKNFLPYVNLYIKYIKHLLYE